MVAISGSRYFPDLFGRRELPQSAFETISTDLEVLGITFDSDVGKLAEDRRDSPGAGAGEGVENEPSGRSDKPRQPKHEIDGLCTRMIIPRSLRQKGMGLLPRYWAVDGADLPLGADEEGRCEMPGIWIGAAPDVHCTDAMAKKVRCDVRLGLALPGNDDLVVRARQMGAPSLPVDALRAGDLVDLLFLVDFHMTVDFLSILPRNIADGLHADHLVRRVVVAGLLGGPVHGPRKILHPVLAGVVDPRDFVEDLETAKLHTECRQVGRAAVRERDNVRARLQHPVDFLPQIRMRNLPIPCFALNAPARASFHGLARHPRLDEALCSHRIEAGEAIGRIGDHGVIRIVGDSLKDVEGVPQDKIEGWMRKFGADLRLGAVFNCVKGQGLEVFHDVMPFFGWEAGFFLGDAA